MLQSELAAADDLPTDAARQLVEAVEQAGTELARVRAASEVIAALAHAGLMSP